MSDLFLKLLNMSLAASWVVLLVLFLRLVIKKAPKWFSCLLWGIVALRLVMPFTLESLFSLIPSAEVIPQDILTSQTPAIQTGIPLINSVVNPLATTQIDALDQFLEIASGVWLVGAAVMVLYAVVAWLRLHRQVWASVLLRDNIYICDDVDSPFILGIFRPKIYVPSGLTEEQLKHVLDHEYAHIRRRDHWWKPLGFALLAVYWFNPLLWLAYSLLCQDIERACDEKVIEKLENAEIRGYLDALIACSVSRRTVMLCPVAFGEIGIKDRIKGIVRYKKPGFWLLLILVLAFLIAMVCLLTNPRPCEHSYQSTITLNPTCTVPGEETFTCIHCQESYVQNVAMAEHNYEPSEILTESTCAEEGTQKFICADCGGEKTEKLTKLPHTPGETSVTKESNCTEEGEISALCTVCGESVVVEKISTNDVHVFENTVIREATCTDPGEGINTCSLCQHSEQCAYELKSHDYDAGEVLKKATCTKDGKKKLTCTVCGEATEEAIEAKGHDWEGATCTKAGICSVCGATGSTASHNYVVIGEFIADWYGELSSRTRECKVCGAQKTLYYSMDGNRKFDLDEIRVMVGNHLKKMGFNVVYATATEGFKYHISYGSINDSYRTQKEFVQLLLNRMSDNHSNMEGGASNYTARVQVKAASYPGEIQIYVQIVKVGS